MPFAGGQPASLAELETRLAAAEAAAAAAKGIFIVSAIPADAIGKDGDIAFAIATPADNGLVYLKSGGTWASTTFQFWKA